MAIKLLKKNHHGRRQMSIDDFSDITKNKPEKSLTNAKKRWAGRNASGKITVRHRGGGARKRYRLIDFKQDKFDVPATVTAIEYDPNRFARIILLNYEDGEKRYIIAPVGLKVGDKIISSRNKIEIKVGNRLTLENIPTGLIIHNIELAPGQGARLARSAGAGVQLMAIEGKFAQLKMPSG